MPGHKINDDEECCVCGLTKKDGVRMRRVDGKVYCLRHAQQLDRHGEIKYVEKVRKPVGDCNVCGKKGLGNWNGDGKSYCRRHLLQLYRYGRILPHTIYEPNDYIDNIEEGYTECILRDKHFNEIGRTLIDLEFKEIVSKYKVYQRNSGRKPYAMVCLKNGEKIFLHRFICDLYNQKYTLENVVDHINGNTLDNRKCNLRVCSQADNMKNIRKGNKHLCGVGWLRENQKWTARITYNYQNLHLGNYDLFEEAVFERLKKEKECFGDYGANSKYYYVLDSENPIEEIKNIGLEKPEQKKPLYKHRKENWKGIE